MKEAKGRFEENPKEPKGSSEKNRHARGEEGEVIGTEIAFTFDFMIFACKFGSEYARQVWEQGKEEVSN